MNSLAEISSHSRPTIIVAGDEFGWGSVGKLSAILDVMRSRYGDKYEFVGLDSRMGRPVLKNQDVIRWLDTATLDDATLVRTFKEMGIVAAVVVLNAKLAIRLQSIGCPMVYVDAVPFLWTEHGRPPTKATRYCAQAVPVLPEACLPALRAIENLRWVGAIVGPSLSRTVTRVKGRALLNLGGLESPLSTPESVTAYLKLVLNPMLGAFRDRGFHHVVIVGNADINRLPFQDEVAGGVTISGGRLSRHDFLQELSTAEVIATAPGRTTLLEIGAMGQRALVLPPQNLSQAMCALEVAQFAGSEVVLNWPSDAVDVATILRERGRGEDFAVRMLYEQIVQASREWPGGLQQLFTDCVAALDYALNHESNIKGLAVAGFDGADEVVDNLCEVLSVAA